MTRAIDRWGAPASLAAGLAWLLVWLHQRSAHGPTQLNEMRLVAGLTWMDTGKLLVPVLALVLVGLVSLARIPGAAWMVLGAVLLRRPAPTGQPSATG